MYIYWSSSLVNAMMQLFLICIPGSLLIERFFLLLLYCHAAITVSISVHH